MGESRPAVALLLEYDALPGLGHACGHNLIAAAGLGAALAARAVLPGEAGSVLAVGTPAEEGGGGKALEVAAGVFDDVDAALMFHPGVHDWVRAPLTAQEQYRVGFHGRAAHPTGNPTEGIDALAALIELFNVLSALGRRLPEASHIQGIVTQGGTATNLVPPTRRACSVSAPPRPRRWAAWPSGCAPAPPAWPGPPARPSLPNGPRSATSTSATAGRSPTASRRTWSGRASL
ncbi:hypothetical protein OHB00_49115 [Streptomyces sp. NBC_00631]